MKINLSIPPASSNEISEELRETILISRVLKTAMFLTTLYIAIIICLTAIHYDSQYYNLLYLLRSFPSDFFEYAVFFFASFCIIKTKGNAKRFDPISSDKLIVAIDHKLNISSISTYIDKVNAQGRELINLEFEAFEREAKKAEKVVKKQ